MPLYEYRCTSCKATFEVIQKFSDRPLRKCRECSGKLEKIISRSSFSLKGGGWYADDYGKTSGTGKSTEGTSGGTKSSKSKTSDAKGGSASGKSS